MNRAANIPRGPVATMSTLTYLSAVPPPDRPLVWLRGAIRTPPFSARARLEAGTLLRRLQRGETLPMPHSRPMPTIGARCHGLRIPDGPVTWRIIYRTDPDAIIIGEVFAKKTARTPEAIVAACRQRFRAYDAAARE